MLTYIRDVITIDAAFAAELTAEITAKKPAKGSTIYLAARRIKHAPGYTLTLRDHHLVILADEYVGGGAGAAIDLSGAAGSAGATGLTGKAGYASAGTNNTPGGPGGAGGNGASGTRGGNLTLYCGRVQGFAFASRGGAGGRGGNGGAGGAGGSGYVIDHETKFKDPVGTSGGNGGRGGNGGAGAPGGVLAAFYVTPMSAPPVTSVVTGGAAGAAGAAGKGGVGGPESPNGSNGSPGAPGAAGPNGSASAQQVTEAALVQKLRPGAASAELVAVAKEWAAYRVRMGEHYARAFSPARAVSHDHLRLAAREFRFAYMIDPVRFAAAREQARMASAGLTPFGLRRDHYVVPDFPAYEQAFLAYAPLVTPLVSDAKALILHSHSVEVTRSMLKARVANIQAQLGILETEATEVALESQKAQAAVGAIEGKMKALQEQIEAKKEECAQARLEFDGLDIVITVAEAIGAVVAVVGAVYTGGASIIAFAGLLAAAQEKWGSLTPDPVTGEPRYQDKPLAEFITWTEKDGKTSAQVSPEAKALAGGLKDVIKAGKAGVSATIDLIDKGRVLAELGTATVDGSLEGELNALLKRSAELAFDRAQGAMDVEIAKLRAKAVEQRVAQAKADLQAAEALSTSLGADNVSLGRVARLLMRRAQEYMTHLAKFRFLAVRALDIYTLRDHTAQQDFGIGFVHPDVEAHAYAAFERGDGTRALALMEAYSASWSKLPNLIALRDEYLTYAKSPELVTQTQAWTFVPPAGVLAELRAHHAASFEIPLAEIYGGRFECKVDTVAVALVGATASAASIPCVLVHRGEGEARRVDGSLVRTAFPPLALPVSASKVDDGGAMPAGEGEAFWGRSPAAKWRLVLEPQAIAASGVSLDGLTKLVLTIRYKTILSGVSSLRAADAPAVSAAAAALPGAPAALATA